MRSRSGDFAGAAAAFGQWNQFYPGSHWSYVKYALALALDGQCDEAAIPAETAERLLQEQGWPLIESWLAWGYLVCGRDDLYAVSRSRLEGYWADHPDSIDLGMIFYRMLEGDADGAFEIVRRTIEANSPLTAFTQLYMLDNLHWPVADRLAKHPRMQELVRGLEFPPTQWPVVV